MSETSAQSTSPETTNGSPQSQLPVSVSPTPATITTRAAGRNTLNTVKETLWAKNADLLGSAARFVRIPKTCTAAAAPIQSIAAVMWRKSRARTSSSTPNVQGASRAGQALERVAAGSAVGDGDAHAEQHRPG